MQNLGRLILSPFLALTVSATAASLPPVAVEVQVHDYAALPSETLRKFASITQDIVNGTGLAIQVRLCRGNLTVSCESQTGNTKNLIIRIVPGDAKIMKNSRRPPLGQSIADHGGGTYASVFVSPVRDEAMAVDVSWVIILAHAAAHEIGHLLLGQGHAPQGLMKASWDRKDYMAMVQNQLHFTHDELRELARRYLINLHHPDVSVGLPQIGHNLVPAHRQVCEALHEASRCP
jgi:hypothetical protein